ncbi:MAG: lysoplasmalogenase [Clostridia bacterium]|nr:lysoplasmalogenase [Clostridia bacterium]
MKKPNGTQFHLFLSLSLVAFSLLLALVFQTCDRWIAAAAMLFSSFGDLSLMNLHGWFTKHRLHSFVCGGILFMISHLLYAAAFSALLRRNDVLPSVIGIATAILVGIAACLALLCMGAKKQSLTLTKASLLLLYAALLLFDMTAVFAVSFSLAGRGSVWRLFSAAGILFFAVSDFFIGMDKVADSPSLTRFIWIFYPIGQFLLLLAA